MSGDTNEALNAIRSVSIRPSTASACQWLMHQYCSGATQRGGKRSVIRGILRLLARFTDTVWAGGGGHRCTIAVQRQALFVRQGNRESGCPWRRAMRSIGNGRLVSPYRGSKQDTSSNFVARAILLRTGDSGCAALVAGMSAWYVDMQDAIGLERQDVP